MEVRTRDPHSLPEPTIGLPIVSKVAGFTLASDADASSTSNWKANVEHEVTQCKVAGPGAGIMENRFEQYSLFFSVQRLIEKIIELEFLPYLYAELLYQLAGSTLP